MDGKVERKDIINRLEKLEKEYEEFQKKLGEPDLG